MGTDVTVTRGRTLAQVPALSLVIFAMTIFAPFAPAFAQKTVTIPNTFDPDLPDVKSPDKIAQAVRQANKSKTPPDCTTARVTVRALVQLSADRQFTEALGSARQEALQATLSQQGFNKPQYVADWAFAESGDVSESVRVIFDEDKEGPKFKNVTWTPTNGTKRKVGDEIKVKFNVSERAEDGHNNWPSGVQQVQFLALNDSKKLVDSRNYGPRPPPCERRTIEFTYNVLDNPKHVARLMLLAEDAGAPVNQNSEIAEFPIVGKWQGTLRGHGQGNVYNDTAVVSFSFEEERDGTITGTGRAKMTSAPQPFGGCVHTHTRTPDEFEFPISGRHVGDDFHLELPTDLKATFRYTADCPGNKGTGPPVQGAAFNGPGAALAFLRPKVRAEDGAKNSFSTTIATIQVNASIEIHRVPRAEDVGAVVRQPSVPQPT